MNSIETAKKPINGFDFGVNSEESQFKKWCDLVDISELGLSSNEGLRFIIPPKLIEILGSDNLEILRVQSPYAKVLDEKAPPTQNIIVVQKNAVPCDDQLFEQKNDEWNKSLFKWSLIAQSYGEISRSDKVLLLLGIEEYNDVYRGLGVGRFAIHSSFRRKGVGSSFYERFEQVLKSLGYSYIWGINNKENIDFFRKRRLNINELNQNSNEVKYLAPFNMSIKTQYPITIKFFDEELMKKCLRPEASNHEC